MSDWEVGALVCRLQIPGPRNGTSTTPRSDVSWPARTPLLTLTALAGPSGRTVETVELEDLGTTGSTKVAGGDPDAVVRVGVNGTFAAGVVVGVEVVVGDGVVVGGEVDGEVTGVAVVVVDARGALSWDPDVVVKVKTRTTRRIGLDHISRWVAFRGECINAFRFEG